jgi:uncharacterized C2H2 Zn-finger protein
LRRVSTIPTDRDLEDVLGHLCSKCGAVMELRKGVLRIGNKKTDIEFWKCGYCGHRED